MNNNTLMDVCDGIKENGDGIRDGKVVGKNS